MNGFVRLYENELTIPGVRGSHRILQVTDTHICCSDAESKEWEARQAEERNLAWRDINRGFAESYHEELTEANTAESTLDGFHRIMEYLRGERPELLLFSGDILDYMHSAGERALRTALSELDVPWLCVPGNHEDGILEGVWNGHIGIYRGEGFTVCAIDDRRKTVTDTTLQELSALIAEGIPLIVMMHIPVATDRNRAEMESKADSYFILDEKTDDENGARFVRMLEETDCIRALLCGHTHGYIKTEIAPGKPQICASPALIGSVHQFTVHG